MKWTTDGNSLHPTHQWMEPEDDDEVNITAWLACEIQSSMFSSVQTT